MTIHPLTRSRRLAPGSGRVAYDVHARLEHSYAEYKHDALKR